ncbi:hypothetical protein SETIT_2G293800v2 [Setaria italica]|uniref:Uncharacterized protein n=1 Tax=Setaria italica TaxID=4555 RepID=A0A368Q414_SETIT|nr:hypothetical protein SETIT_2G293800v2 [Setaria italica]
MGTASPAARVVSRGGTGGKNPTHAAAAASSARPHRRRPSTPATRTAAAGRSLAPICFPVARRRLLQPISRHGRPDPASSGVDLVEPPICGAALTGGGAWPARIATPRPRRWGLGSMAGAPRGGDSSSGAAQPPASRLPAVAVVGGCCGQRCRRPCLASRQPLSTLRLRACTLRQHGRRRVRGPMPTLQPWARTFGRHGWRRVRGLRQLMTGSGGGSRPATAAVSRSCAPLRLVGVVNGLWLLLRMFFARACGGDARSMCHGIGWQQGRPRMSPVSGSKGLLLWHDEDRRGLWLGLRGIGVMSKALRLFRAYDGDAFGCGLLPWKRPIWPSPLAYYVLPRGKL